MREQATRRETPYGGCSITLIFWVYQLYMMGYKVYIGYRHMAFIPTTSLLKSNVPLSKLIHVSMVPTSSSNTHSYQLGFKPWLCTKHIYHLPCWCCCMCSLISCKEGVSTLSLGSKVFFCTTLNGGHRGFPRGAMSSSGSPGMGFGLVPLMPIITLELTDLVANFLQFWLM